MTQPRHDAVETLAFLASRNPEGFRALVELTDDAGDESHLRILIFPWLRGLCTHHSGPILAPRPRSAVRAAPRFTSHRTLEVPTHEERNMESRFA